ncbi:hypothetical protein GZH52_14990 [Crenobacter sp. HX-7-9]|uniref:Uncharacterized protein n=2 Tax=Crenobacter caeni TaxID=2705474 RepID=A0A6B2KVA3_9NEIS|nr:hypothetical protein [Crenobacter caeni]
MSVKRNDTNTPPETANQPWQPRALSKAEFHGVLREKGLSLSDAAFLWEVSVATASRIAANPDRPAHWLFALAALPTLRAAELKALHAQRRRQGRPARPKPGEVIQAMTVSAELYESVACHATCGLAEEGDADGYIKAVRGSGTETQFLVCFPAGEDWFGAALFDDYFYTTGRIVRPEKGGAAL